MSRVATPPVGQPVSTPKIPHEKIAMRAYEKWVQRGRPHGTDVQDWVEAESELRQELGRSAGTIRPGEKAPGSGPAGAPSRTVDLSFVAASFNGALVLHPTRLARSPVLEPWGRRLPTPQTRRRRSRQPRSGLICACEFSPQGDAWNGNADCG